MSIVKSHRSQYGAMLSWHEIDQIVIKAGDAFAVVCMKSWPTRDERLQGMPCADSWYLTAPVAALFSSSPVELVEQLLTGQQSSPLMGGSVAASPVDTLEQVQAAKWALIKQARSLVSNAPIEFKSHQFQADPSSQNYISRKATEAGAALGGDPAWQLGMLSEANLMVAMTAQDVIDLDAAIQARSQQAWDLSQLLRASIYSEDATIASVNAVAWTG